ncbi:hypothetical protein AAG906_034635 [Vitis piasezkii]
MKETKVVKDYTDRLLMLKLLVTLPERFESKISSLEESKDLNEETIKEAFQVKEVDQAQGGNKGKKQWSKKNNKKGENNNNGGNKGKHPPCPYCKKTSCRNIAGLYLTFSVGHANSWGIWRGSSSSDNWLIDSGCTNHMSFDESLFNEVNKSEVLRVRIGNEQYIEVKGMTYNGTGTTICGVCQLGKQARLPFLVNKAWRAIEKLQLIHTNVCGPMRTASLSGNSSKHGLKIKVAIELRSLGFCEVVGIEHQLTTTYTPQQNGVSERKNMIIMEMARCLVFEKEMPKIFWAEAVNTTIFMLNRLPTKALKGKTPFEACSNKGYKIYQPLTEKIIVSRDVKFDEAARWNWNKTEPEQAYAEEKEPELQVDDVINDEPIKGTRSLTKIYQMCNMAVFEPAGYDEAVKDPKWIATIEEKIKMIHKNQT